MLIADGGEAIADLAVLRNQPGLFGLVASPATCWRVLDAVDADMLAALKQARAAAREQAWLLRGEAGGGVQIFCVSSGLPVGEHCCDHRARSVPSGARGSGSWLIG